MRELKQQWRRYWMFSNVLFFKTGSDVCYFSFADTLQADWFIRNAQITWAVISDYHLLHDYHAIRIHETTITRYFAIAHTFFILASTCTVAVAVAVEALRMSKMQIITKCKYLICIFYAKQDKYSVPPLSLHK